MNDKLLQYQKLFERSIGKRDILLKRKNENSKKIIELELRLDKTEKAQIFIQALAQKVQNNIRYHIEDIVQMAIDACFPNRYNFRLEFKVRRNQTEADLNFYEGKVSIDLMGSSGGGLVNIACFAIRIAAWSLSRTKPIILLDEPFSNLSEDLQPKAGEILKELSDKLKFQIILVTHNKDTMTEIADKVIEVKMKEEGVWNKSYMIVRKDEKINE